MLKSGDIVNLKFMREQIANHNPTKNLQSDADRLYQLTAQVLQAPCQTDHLVSSAPIAKSDVRIGQLKASGVQQQFKTTVQDNYTHTFLRMMWLKN